MPGATTNYGWPKPINSDPIAQGADTIGQALDKIDGQTMVPAGTFVSTTPYGSWPLGVSIMNVPDTASADAGGWPNPVAAGGIVTHIRQAGRGFQLYYTSTYAYYRVANSSGGGAWVAIVGATIPTAFATGGVANAAITPGTVTTIPITFPTGRFTSPPRVYLTLASLNPQNYAPVSASAVTATGFNILAYSATASAISVNWQAVLGAT